MKAGVEKTLRIFTVGHSNLSFEQFASLLKEHEIGLVADIRLSRGSFLTVYDQSFQDIP